MMNSIRPNVRLGLHSYKENSLVSNKHDATLQVQKAQQRTVLGVLAENTQHSRCVSEGGRLPDHGSCSDGSTSTFLTLTNQISSSARDVQTDDRVFDDMEASATPCEDEAMQQHNDFRLFLDLSTNADESMTSQPDDSLHSHDVFCASEYTEEIHHYLRQRELKCRPKVGYMQHHPELTSNMRMVLVDWLVEVSVEYKLCDETLHLAICYLDRFLSLTKSVKRSELQLVGTAALMIAAKYEEIYPPELKEFVYITDDTYSRARLLKIEIIFIKVLAFQLSTPTVQYFLKQYMTVQSVCSQTESLALYVSDLSLLEVEPFIQYVPSVVAAAAYCLANYTVNTCLWPVSLESFTGYTLAELAPCLEELHKLYRTAKKLPQRSIRGKYNSSKYDYVSQMSAPAVIHMP